MAGRTFWRIVRTDPPTERDFMSNDALGRRPRDRDPETLRLWSGISVHATAREARRTAAAFPMLGSFVARVRVRDDDPILVEKTLGPGHYTLWGDASLFLTRVEIVLPLSI
jgi:hypothetical protein